MLFGRIIVDRMNGSSMVAVKILDRMGGSRMVGGIMVDGL